MIKIILGAAIIFILILLCVYGMISFLIWNGDVSTWTISDRFLMVALGLIFGGGTVSAYVMLKIDKDI